MWAHCVRKGTTDLVGVGFELPTFDFLSSFLLDLNSVASKDGPCFTAKNNSPFRCSCPGFLLALLLAQLVRDI